MGHGVAPLTHIVVIRRDMTFGDYSAQLDHGGEAYALAPTFEFNTTVSQIKGARNESKLAKLEPVLIADGVPHVAVREEQGEKGGRLAGQLTCISLMPCDPDKLPPATKKALNEFHRIEALDGPKPIPG